MPLDPPSPAAGSGTLPPPRLDDLGRPPAPAPARSSGPGRTLLLAVGGLVAAVAIAQGTLALVSLWFRTSDTAPLALGGGRITDVRIDVDAGTVRLTPGEAVAGQRTERYGFLRPRVDVERDGGALMVTGRCARAWVTGSWCSTAVTLTVPADVRVTVRTGAGDVHLGAVRGEVVVTSGAGDVTLTDTAGPVTVESGAGDVRATGLTGAVVHAQSGAGRVSLDFGTPPADVRAESGAGSVTVVLPAGETAYRVDADSGAGSRTVDVRTSPTADAQVYAHSGAGDVTVRYAR